MAQAFPQHREAGSHRAVKQLIKILIMAEDNVAAHVKQKAFWRNIRARQTACFGRLRIIRSSLVSTCLCLACSQVRVHLVDKDPVGVTELI